MIRRLKSQVLDLPPKTRDYLSQTLTPAQKKLYETWEEEAAKAILTSRLNRWASIVAEETRTLIDAGKTPREALKLAKDNWKELLQKVDSKNSLHTFQMLRMRLGLLRVPMVAEWVSDFYQNQNPKKPETLLIFAEHHQVMDLLKKEISKIKIRGKKPLKVEKYSGKTSLKRRKEIQEQVQNGDINVLILNRAGNEGINLQRASYVLFAERYYKPGEEEQAEDRAHRSGQKIL